jgi:hypothetical protein
MANMRVVSRCWESPFAGDLDSFLADPRIVSSCSARAASSCRPPICFAFRDRP